MTFSTLKLKSLAILGVCTMLFFIETACVSASAAAQKTESPQFEDEKAIVLAIDSVRGKAIDEIKVVNETHEKTFDAEIYVYEKRNEKWRSYGIAELTGIHDTDRVISRYSGDLVRFSHVAVVPSIDTPVTAFIKKSHHDIYIYLFSNGSLENLCSVDTKSVKGAFHDNIKVCNYSTELENLFFDVFVRNTQSSPWLPAGVVYLKGTGDSDTLETPISKISSYRYVALVAENGEQFTLDIEKMNNDLYIYIED